MTKVVILTEGGSDIGFGHITRCISLYQAFEDRGIVPMLIVNGDEIAEALLKDKQHEVFNWLEERERLSDLLRCGEITIIDSYLAGLELYEDISKAVRVSAYIDDNKRLDYPRGVIINSAVNAQELNYAPKNNLTYLLGSKYALLRKDFWEVPGKEIGEDVDCIAVTFGGEDLRNLTPKVLKSLTDYYPDTNKIVVVGAGFKNAKEIEEFKDEHTKIIYNPGAGNMKDLLLESDAVVSAGGQTLYELAAVGAAGVAVAAADNQLNNIKAWQEARFIEYGGWWEDEDMTKNVMTHIEKLRNKDARSAKNVIGRTFIDGKGSLRICDVLLKKGAH